MPEYYINVPATGGTTTTGGGYTCYVNAATNEVYAVPYGSSVYMNVTMGTTTTVTYGGQVYQRYLQESRDRGLARARAQMQERAQIQEQQRAAQESYEARQALRQEAEARARELLTSMLDESQRAQLEARGGFEFVGSNGHTYWIHCRDSYVGNVLDVSESRNYCCHPVNASEMPRADSFIAQFLALSIDAERFLEVAHVY